jgi:RNA polymerase sigma factor (sigma-70 family)
MELKFKNAVLWHAIFDLYPSVHAFCESAMRPRVGESVVGALLCLKRSPYLKTGQPSISALRVSMMTGLSIEALFPRDLYSGKVPTDPLVMEQPLRALSPGRCQALLMPPAQETDLGNKELRDALDRALETLPPAQECVLRARFFEDLTLEEVAGRLGVTRERIRQIEITGLQRLRRRHNAVRLRPFAEEPVGS